MWEDMFFSLEFASLIIYICFESNSSVDICQSEWSGIEDGGNIVAKIKNCALDFIACKEVLWLDCLVYRDRKCANARRSYSDCFWFSTSQPLVIRCCVSARARCATLFLFAFPFCPVSFLTLLINSLANCALVFAFLVHYTYIFIYVH